MNTHTLLIKGELYLSLETVAEIYQIQVIWLREAYDFGLLGAGVSAGARTCIAAIQLDRVASVVRLHDVVGLDLETIRLVLDE